MLGKAGMAGLPSRQAESQLGSGEQPFSLPRLASGHVPALCSSAPGPLTPASLALLSAWSSLRASGNRQQGGQEDKRQPPGLGEELAIRELEEFLITRRPPLSGAGARQLGKEGSGRLGTRAPAGDCQRLRIWGKRLGAPGHRG